jgi:hypothetical protein
MAPVGGGGVMSLNRYVMDAKRKSRPIRLRTTMTVHFITLPP